MKMCSGGALTSSQMTSRTPFRIRRLIRRAGRQHSVSTTSAAPPPALLVHKRRTPWSPASAERWLKLRARSKNRAVGGRHVARFRNRRARCGSSARCLSGPSRTSSSSMSICGRADLARPTIWISFVDKALWSSNLPTASRGPVGERSPKSTFGGRGEVSEVGASQLPEWRDKGDELPLPRSIGSIYRALRRRPEDSKDEPGAADFYSGGMEMRRAARPERIILWLYRLVSGYGLRASRALGALLIL